MKLEERSRRREEAAAKNALISEYLGVMFAES
jgi:hypothetical protein